MVGEVVSERLWASDLGDAHGIVAAAREEHRPSRTFLLLSGGNDSMVLLDACGDMADEIVHINTGVGIPETNEFVRDTVADLGRPLTELHPPIPYDELVLDPKYWGGFPGPGAHQYAYQRLKERCLRWLLRQHRTRRGERFMLLTGVRSDESQRRMGSVLPVDRRGGQVWVNPLLRWSNETMREYRTVQRVPTNEVAVHLHMSGECLCGAFAHPGELDEIGIFYPKFVERIRKLEVRAEAEGLRACTWGVRPPGSRRVAAPGPLCHQCSLWDDDDEVAA